MLKPFIIILARYLEIIIKKLQFGVLRGKDRGRIQFSGELKVQNMLVVDGLLVEPYIQWLRLRVCSVSYLERIVNILLIQKLLKSASSPFFRPFVCSSLFKVLYKTKPY